jgi:hypothetical protein
LEEGTRYSIEKASRDDFSSHAIKNSRITQPARQSDNPAILKMCEILFYLLIATFHGRRTPPMELSVSLIFHELA